VRSIQRNLTLSLVAGALVLLVVAALSIDRLLVSQLARDFDDNLLSKARVIASLVERDAGVIEFDRISRFMPEFESREPLEYYELSLADGRLFHKSPSMEKASLAGSPEASGRPTIRHIALPGGKPGRMVAFSFSPRVDSDPTTGDDADEEAGGDSSEDLRRPDDTVEVDDDEVIYHLSREDAKAEVLLSIRLAKSTAGLERLIMTSRTILGGAFAILVMGLAVVSWFFVRRNLEPLRKLSGEVHALDENSLYMRVQQAGNVRELAPISSQLNRLLDRLEKAFQREKRFSGDVAHELKTPISELRTMSEVGREWAGERELVEGFFGDLVNLADDMERTVSNLLALARLDAGNHRVEPEEVELDRLVDDIWKRFGETASTRHISLDNSVPVGTTVVTDRDKLTIILVNIVANATAYSPTNSMIEASAHAAESGDAIALEISNIAPDLDKDDLEFMLERFWRKDESRTGSGHAGLGLSLVSELAGLMGITLDTSLGDDARFTLSLSGMARAAPSKDA